MNYPDLASLPFLHPLGIFLLPALVLVVLWTVVIKGIALWKSARSGQKFWFIAVLIVNSLGILELIYLIWFTKEPTKVAPAPAPAPASAP